MNTNHLIEETLTKMGVKYEYDEDGDLYIMYQMKYIYVVHSQEQKFILLAFSSFFEVEEGQEMQTLVVCNKITRENKLIKVFLNQSMRSVSASCEFFYTDRKSLENNIKKSLDIMSVARTLFKKTHRELSKE